MTNASNTPPAAEQPIHLHRANYATNACGRRAAGSRSTRYPALVTCSACRQAFSKDEQRSASPSATEPEDC